MAQFNVPSQHLQDGLNKTTKLTGTFAPGHYTTKQERSNSHVTAICVLHHHGHYALSHWPLHSH
jgi:hypothetical protein